MKPTAKEFLISKGYHDIANATDIPKLMEEYSLSQHSVYIEEVFAESLYEDISKATNVPIDVLKSRLTFYPHRINPNPDHVVESNEKIKLPGYKKLRAFMNQDEFIEKTTWNACLDEVKRLNKIKLNNLE